MTPAKIAGEVKMIEWFDDHWYKIEHSGVTNSGKPQTETIYLPSVTTILGVTAKPFLAHWRGDIGNREADLRMAEGAERGTRLHNAWSIYCQGGAVIYNPHLRPNYTFEQIDDLRTQYADRVAILPTQDEMYQMTKLEALFKALKPTHILTESVMFSIKNGRAGTCDNFIALEAGEYQINGNGAVKLEKGLYVADLKTGKVVDDDAFMQISDYGFMLEEMAALGVDWAAELISKYGKVQGGMIIHTSAKTRSGIEGLATLVRSREQLIQDQEDMNRIHAIWKRKNSGAKPDVFEFPSLIVRKEETT